MQFQDNTGTSYTIFLYILLSGCAAMFVATEFDILWTQFFHRNKIDWYAIFMNEALSSSDKQLGANDLVYCLLVIPGTIFYFLSWLFCIWLRDKQLPFSFLIKEIISIRPYLGFIITSAFCSAFLFVHTAKQIVGRARPDVVFSGNMPYSDWYGFGPHFITQGTFSGSFPSGHTATASILIAFAYVMLDFKHKRQWMGRLLLGLSLIFAGGMGVARMMSASHWATDVVFTVFACWMIIHVIFHWGLRVPSQIIYFREHGKHKIQKPLFELQICLYMFLLCLGIWEFFTGIRSSNMSDWPWLKVLIPLGMSSIFFCLEKLWSIGLFRKKVQVRRNLDLKDFSSISANELDA